MTRRKKRFKKRDFSKGVYLLPNLATSLNLFCGFFSVVSSLDGHFVQASVAIIVAGVFDNLDGRIARATRSTSRFGVEYDSLADLVSFGMAPALLAFLWALRPFGRLGWLAAFLFVACGALRLARFNTQVGQTDGSRFTGLPIPAAAGMAATLVLFHGRLGHPMPVHPLAVLVLLYALSYLMVSSIPYHSFKKKVEHRSFNSLVLTLLVLIFIAAEPDVALFMVAVTYMVSGPVRFLYERLKHSKEDEPEAMPLAKPEENSGPAGSSG
ncbi:MAG: CDP-diacylglycerol--serine O-phosphatidyltransferase [Acidobacteria bacterium 37-65-4]|nr:MAG: CDP-diacylglycerol--serine O-phosphatidyltransferase [Acidobacteria bacterium 37-65-4]